MQNLHDKPVVLVLGVGGNAGRNFVKCLRRSSLHPMIIGWDLDAHYLAACDADVKCRTPDNGPGKLDLLRQAVREWRVQWIHAQPEPEVDFVAQHQDEFPGLVVPVAHQLLRVTRDKWASQQCWGADFKFEGELFDNVSANRFHRLRGRDGRVWIRSRYGAGSRAALPVRELGEAQAWVRYWGNNRGMSSDDFMLAPYLPGPEFAVQMLWWNGGLVHCQARERVTHFFAAQSPSGQSSTPAVARTVRTGEVVEAAVRAVNLLATGTRTVLHGIYGVDLRCDGEGRPVPTECNYGRFFTTVDFFARLGMNTPEALWRLLRGESVAPQVNTCPADWYWVRGLDQEPKLCRVAGEERGDFSTKNGK